MMSRALLFVSPCRCRGPACFGSGGFPNVACCARPDAKHPRTPLRFPVVDSSISLSHTVAGFYHIAGQFARGKCGPERRGSQGDWSPITAGELGGHPGSRPVYHGKETSVSHQETRRFE